MSHRPGSHLSKIGAGSVHLPGFGRNCPVSSGEIGDQVIKLRTEDIYAKALPAPFLDWSKTDKDEVAVQLKDLDGFADGNVTLKASTLRRLHPSLVPAWVDPDYLFHVSLKSVVMQVQGNLRRGADDGPVSSGSEFETAIAQVAREDEDRFKLEKFQESREPAAETTIQAKAISSEPVLTPADRPATRPPANQNSTQGPADPVTSTAVALRALMPGPVAVSGPEAKPMGLRLNAKELMAKDDRERHASERIREIFMTDEYLSADSVAHRIACLPRICSALVMSADGTVLGGTLPEGYRLEAAILAPALMRKVKEFGRGLRSSETTVFTILGEIPVSLFAEGNIHILICHEVRGFVPGMQSMIREIANALNTISGEKC